MVLMTDYANIYLCPSGDSLTLKSGSVMPGPAVNMYQCSGGSTPQVYNPLIDPQKPDLTGKSAWISPGLAWDTKNDIKSFFDRLSLFGWITLIILIVLVIMIIANFIMSIVGLSRLGSLQEKSSVIMKV